MCVYVFNKTTRLKEKKMKYYFLFCIPKYRGPYVCDGQTSA